MIRDVSFVCLEWSPMNRFRVAVLTALSLVAAVVVLPIPSADAADRKAAQQMAPSQEVRNLQLALNRKGARLPVDGMMNAKTVAALKAYQQKNKLNATGELDPRTKAAFGMH